MDVQPPKSLKCALKVPQKLLMGPGPSNCPPRVLHALSQPVIGHLHGETTKIMDDIKEGIQYIFQTNNELTLALSTSGHGGMDAVFCNLVEPGDKVLVAINGIWGERAANMASRYGADVVSLNAKTGNNFTAAEFEHALQKHKPILLFVTQGESSTGVYQSVENLGHLCHKYGCLLAVDTVASLGGVPMFADKWGIDAIYTGSQKVLGAPPGLTPISFSNRAKEKMFNRRSPIAVFYLDMTILGDYWYCFGRPRVYHHTISTTLLYGLREALSIVIEEGLQNTIQRHSKCAQRLYKGLGDLGLELFVQEPAKRIPTVTTIVVPEDVNWQDVVSYLMKNYLLEISGGLGPTAGKVFRIGLMGYNATEENVDVTLKYLKEAIEFSKSQKHSKL